MDHLLNEMDGSTWTVTYKNKEFFDMYFSPSSERIYGRTLEELSGNTDKEFEFAHPDDVPLLSYTLDHLKENPNVEIQYRIIRPDNSIVWLNSKMRYVEDGDITRIHGFDTDITELMNVKHKLEKSLKVKSFFLSMMTHEIRTPLTGIMGFIELLSDTELDEEQNYLLKQLTVISNSLRTMLENILDITKSEFDQLSINIEQFPLYEMINKNILVMILPFMEEKSIEFIFDYDETIDLIETDSLRLQQILINLLTNAIKFTDHLGKIKLTVKRKNDKIYFEVLDNGVGIDEDNLKLIFEPFEQVDKSRKRKYEGTGMGLVIVSKLLEILGSKINVESEIGKGSKFYFEI